MTIKPKKFVGLHSHTHFSVGDGLGTPDEHIQFAIENGADALACTDHGNMNAYTHQQAAAKKLKDKGVNFFAVPGVEAYYIPSLEKWNQLKEQRAQEKTEQKEQKKVEKKGKKELQELPDDIADSQTAMSKEDISETLGGTVIEDEDETKKMAKFLDPIKQRSHLVLLPKNREGLRSIFRIISESYINGFYRYPRIDLDMLRKHANGNIIALSACVGGYPGHIVYKNQEEASWDDYKINTPNSEQYEIIQKELKTMVEEFQDALGVENYYLELQFNNLLPQHLLNQHLIECSKRTGAPLVTTCDAHYARPELWREREIYKMMAWVSKTKQDVNKDALPKAIDELKCELYPKNAEQMWQTYKETTRGFDFYDDEIVKNSIERSWSIAHEQIDKNNLDPDKSVKLPSLHKVVGMKTLAELDRELQEMGQETDEDREEALAFQALKKRAIDGLLWRKKGNEKEYIERLKHELSVVKKLKFSRYFLTYAKIMEIAAKHVLLGPARGSAGGSLLAFVLNITQIDPIRYGLLFERFLTPYKKGYPDIDSDFSDRDTVIKLVADHFGEFNVIPVSNFNQLQIRSLIKDLLRLENVPFEEVNAYTAKIEKEAREEARKTPGFDAQLWVLTYEEAEDKSPTFRELIEKYPDVKVSMQVLFKAMRGVSRHAGGVIISEDVISNMPIIKSGGVFQTPWPEGMNFRHLESLGFLKFDILGLGTLRMYEETIRRILKKKNGTDPTFQEISDWYYQNMHPDNNNLDDQKVYENVYWKGRYAGIFQFTETKAQRFIQQMRPKSIIDIATATSIVRPGPLAIRADALYLKNRNDPKSIRYKHPLLEEVLSETYGLIIFQEQLQLIYHKLAGVPLDQTDDVRKAFTKKDISNKEAAAQAREELRNEFIEKCQKVNNIDPQISGEIFDELEKFVSYSFNKSHAIAYAIVSYMCAWLFTYYPDEWIASYIDYNATQKGKSVGHSDPKSVALSEAQQLGYAIGKPDINLCEREFDVKNKTLIPSFASLKYCGTSAVDEIMKYRPYNTLEDLLVDENGQWRHSKFNKRALSTLIKLEAFDSMGLVGDGDEFLFKNYKQMHDILVDRGDEIKRYVARKRKDKTIRGFVQHLISECGDTKDWTLKEKNDFSIELAGSSNMNLIVTPEIREYFVKNKIKSIDNWKNDGGVYWAVVSNCSIAKTKSGKDYLRLKISSDTSDNTCFLWNFNQKKGHKKIPEHTLILGPFEKNDFGFTASFNQIECILSE